MSAETPPDAAAVAAAFGLGRPTGPLSAVARGAMGQVWRLRTQQGDYAAKQLFEWARGEERIAIEARVVNAAIAAGVAAPAMIAGQDGSYVATIGAVRWRMFAWAELERVARPPLTADEARAIGAVLAKLHGLNLTADASEVIPWFMDRAPETRWRALAAKVREVAPLWAGLLRDAFPKLVELAATALPKACLRPCLISHCDLNDGNVYFDEKGPILIDWEHAGAIPPSWELGSVLHAWVVGEDGQDDVDTARAILAGYRDAGGAREPASMDMFAGAISAHLNWTMGRIHQAATETNPAERERAEVSTRRLITHCLSRGRLQAIVDALNR